MYCLFFFNDTATTEIYTLSLHDALPISQSLAARVEELMHQAKLDRKEALKLAAKERSEEHTSELQSRLHLVCRLLLEKKKTSDPMRRRPAMLPLYTFRTLCVGRFGRKLT